MKKKIFLALSLIAILALLFAISISAAEPVEEWTLISGNSGTMTAAVYMDAETEEYRLEINSAPTRNPLTIPYGASNSWASYKELITSVTVSEGTLAVSDMTFANMTKLRSVELGEGLSRIGTAAFENCNSLESITLPIELDTVGSNVFAHCGALREIVIPKNVRTVGVNAFLSCASLERVSFEGDVCKIETSTFQDCGSLVEIELPKSLTYIGARAFEGCRNLENIEIPVGVTEIGNRAFAYCNKLTIYLEGDAVPNSWSASWNPEKRPCVFGDIHVHKYTATVLKEATHGEKGAISYLCDCGDSYTEETPTTGGAHEYVATVVKKPGHTTAGETLYTCSCGASYKETVPALGGSHVYEEIIELEPTHTNEGAIRYTCDCGYSYTKKIDKIKHNFIDGVCDCGLVISDGPVEIWDMSYNSRELVTAFLYHDPEAEGLFRLVIRGNGRGRWYNTPWKIYKDEISEVVFENGVKYDVPGRGFENFTELRRVILGDGIEMIGNGAFRGCQNLQYVEVTEALRRIEPTAFADCKSLEIVEGISKLERLGGNAFINCISLYRFDAEYVREIQPRAFANCQGLKEVSVIGGIEILGDGAFERCVCLTDVGNLDNLQRMGRYVFRDCLEIRTLILNDNCELTMDAAFANMRNLETVIITGKVTEIPRYTFQGCRNLKTVYINTYDPVIVKRAAFADCNNLKNLVIKGGILDIEEEAFRMCRALEGVYIETESPISIKMRAFEQCVSLKSVIVTGGIMSIGDSAFGGCIALEEITLSEHTEAIGANAFSQCRAMKQIFIPNSVQSISRYAFNGCNRLTIYTEDGVDLGAFDNCNPNNRPVVSGAIRDEFFIDRHCPHYEYEEWVEKEPTHHSIGLLLRKCLICGNCDGEILEPHIDHELSEWKSDGSATHTRYCACGYTETNNHIFQSGECVECGLKKTVLVRDDIECVEMTNGGIDFEILFDGAKNTTGLYENSNIEYYPSSKHDYIIITLKQEVDLGGIIFWICGDKSSARVTVYDSNNRKTGEGVVRFNGGDYYDGKSLPANVTFFGTAPAKYIKIETENLDGINELSQKISEIELMLGTKVDIGNHPGNTKIDVVLDIPTLNAIGIEITPEIIEKVTEGLEVNGEIGQIILDAISMGKISGVGGNVTIGINDITTDKESKTGKRVFSITVNDENGNPILPPESRDENGTLTLSFKYKAGLKKEQIKVVYRDENGKIEHMEVESYDPETGIVQFKTNHLSDYEFYADGVSNDAMLDGAFTFKGYSINETTGEMSIGFNINYEIIREYEEIMERTVDFGVVFASYELLGGQNPFDTDGNVTKLENGAVMTRSLSDQEYLDYKFKIVGLTEELYDHKLVISAYAKGESGVYYYQDAGMSTDVHGVSYNDFAQANKEED